MGDPQLPGPDTITLSSSTRDVVLAVGTTMGKTAAQMEPFVRYLQQEWLEGCAALREAGDDAEVWGALRLPARLKLKIKQVVRNAAARSSGDGRFAPQSVAAPSTVVHDENDKHRIAPSSPIRQRMATTVGGDSHITTNGNAPDVALSNDEPQCTPRALLNPTPSLPPPRSQANRGVRVDDVHNPSPTPLPRGGAVGTPAGHSAAPYPRGDSPLTPQAPQPQSPADLWRMAIDNASQRPYFYNVETGESRWSTPPDLNTHANNDSQNMAAYPHGVEVEDGDGAGAGEGEGDEYGYPTQHVYPTSTSMYPSYPVSSYSPGRGQPGDAQPSSGFEPSYNTQLLAASTPEPYPPSTAPPHVLRAMAGSSSTPTNGIPSPIVGSDHYDASSRAYGFTMGDDSGTITAMLEHAGLEEAAAGMAAVAHATASNGGTPGDAAPVHAAIPAWAVPDTAQDAKQGDVMPAAVIAQPTHADTSPKKWQCLACTYLNHARTTRCAMCSCKKPELEAAARPVGDLIATGVPVRDFHKAAFSYVRHKRNSDLKALFANKVISPFITDIHKNTLLIVAAQNGNISAAKLLLKQGVDVNARNKKGRTAFHFAVQFGFAHVAELLLMNGAVDDDVPSHHTRIAVAPPLPARRARPAPSNGGARLGAASEPETPPGEQSRRHSGLVPAAASSARKVASPSTSSQRSSRRNVNNNDRTRRPRRTSGASASSQRPAGVEALANALRRPIAGGVVPGPAELDAQEQVAAQQAAARARGVASTSSRNARGREGRTNRTTRSGATSNGRGKKPKNTGSWRQRLFKGGSRKNTTPPAQFRGSGGHGSALHNSDARDHVGGDPRGRSGGAVGRRHKRQ